MPRHVAAYVRVSTRQQDTKSQEPDLHQWTTAHANGLPVVWYADKATGRSMDRPGWRKLASALRQGKVAAIVCWRLDRLGRTVAGLSTLFDELRQRKVNLVSLKEGVDLSTPAGRLMANVIASMAQFETEVRGERVAAGQAAARAAGKRWGGSKPGQRKKVTPAKEAAVKALRGQGQTITAIAKAVGLSRPTVYDVLASLA